MHETLTGKTNKTTVGEYVLPQTERPTALRSFNLQAARRSVLRYPRRTGVFLTSSPRPGDDSVRAPSGPPSLSLVVRSHQSGKKAIDTPILRLTGC